MRLRSICAQVFWAAAVSQAGVRANPAPSKSPRELPYSSLAPNDRGFEHLTYTIPKNAVRSGPFGLRSSGLRTTAKQYYLYSDPKTGDRLAREVFVLDLVKKTKTRVKLELYKNKLKHGVQREWYDSGKPKSVAPYKKWIMHGTFKHWDKDGKLIGWYKIINGKGVRRQYYSNGRLHREVTFEFNRRHGPIRLFYENGQISAITQQAYGEPCGTEVGFWPDGRFEDRIWGDCQGHFHLMILNETGPKQKQRSDVTYYVHGTKVSKKQYLAAAAKDASLPKPLDDPEKYKVLSEREKRIIEHYKKLKRVKIPLEAPTDNTLPFDVQENDK